MLPTEENWLLGLFGVGGAAPHPFCPPSGWKISLLGSGSVQELVKF
jgi:hypothetical protein